MKYDLVIFDLDGTLLDTLDDITHSCNVALENNGLPIHTKEEVRFMVGNGIPKLIQRAIPENANQKLFDKVLQDFLNHYQKHSSEKTKPYDGMVDCLKNLKNLGIKLAVNSNKVESASIELCSRFYPGIFDCVAGNVPERRVKPFTDGVEYILKKTGCKSAVYVGDSDVDIATGKNAGIPAIGVDWGFRGKDFLIKNGAVQVAMNPEELYKIIRS